MLDYPDKITHLAAFDIIPTEVAWDAADDRMMLGFWPWSLLAQPSPLPERILEATAKEIVNNACDNWGSSPTTFSAETRDTYIRALQDPEHIHAICEEYRASATIDREHDRIDKQNNHTITCPTLILWSAGGALDTWYTETGRPLASWRSLAPAIQGEAVQGGHFFPEEMPEVTYRRLKDFLD